MARTISIGCQNYETIRREKYFYIDKTSSARYFQIFIPSMIICWREIC